MSRSPILFESTVGKGGNVDEVSEVDQHGVVFIPPRAGAAPAPFRSKELPNVVY